MESVFAANLPPEEVGNEAAMEAAVAAATANESVAPTLNSVATLSNAWQYDELHRNCASCQSEFHAINRRHHCRMCGKIFCASCSEQKALIPPSSIVLVPQGGKKVKPRPAHAGDSNFSMDEDPDRMLTYLSENNKELLYGKGLEERFRLARQPLRCCRACFLQLQPLQEELRRTNANAMRFNAIDPTDLRRLFNSPLAFTLGHEIRKAAYTLNNLLPLPKRRMGAVLETNMPYPFHSAAVPSAADQCKDSCSSVSPTLGNIDGVRIPARLLQRAAGIAVLTVLKGGFGLAGVEFGTGLVVARLPDGRWSAPSAIGCGGVSWGALVGAQVSDHVFILMNAAAVELMFRDSGSVQLGADIGVAVGPVGRAVEAGGVVGNQVAPIYTYSQSKGLYAGVSVDGKILKTRPDVNESFYGRRVSAQEILRGAVPTPPAAQPLYEALQRCHVYATNDGQTRSVISGVSDEQQLAGEYGEVASHPRLIDHRTYLSDLTSEGM